MDGAEGTVAGRVIEEGGGEPVREETDADSGRPQSMEDDDEDEEGLVIKVPERKEDERQSGQEPTRAEMPRIPTLVCEEHTEEDVPASPNAVDPPRRIARALSKQCVIDDDSNVQPLCILVDTRGSDGTGGMDPQALPQAKDEPSGSSSLTGRQWEQMADRRRLLAAQLLGRTPLALSQSDGNLGHHKSFPPLGCSTSSGGGTPTKTASSGGGGKHLVRSHAMCGDDDTRLRPPPDFARSNPSFAATKSLSRDSSATDYTDSSGVDLYAFICATLHKNEKDRNMLLDLERQLTEFMESKRQSHKFMPMSSYNRMLVHRVAAYFGLDHNIDQSGQCIVVNKSDNSRIPEQPFASLIQTDVYTDTLRKSLSREAQSYEEIRDYGSPHHRHISAEMRTRSFEVASQAAAWSSGVGSIPEPPGPDAPMSSYALSPVGYDQAEPAEAVDQEGDVRRRSAGVGQLHKAGSFGGVPVIYRANSNGVRPIEEFRGRPKTGRERIRGPPEAAIEPSGVEYYNVPPDPYRADRYRDYGSSSAAPYYTQAVGQQAPRPGYVYIDPYSAHSAGPAPAYMPAAAAAAPPPDYGMAAGPFYGYAAYDMPAAAPAPLAAPQMAAQAPTVPNYNMGELTREMSQTSLSSRGHSSSPHHPKYSNSPAAYVPVAGVPVPGPVAGPPVPQPLMQPAFFQPVYQRYPAVPSSSYDHGTVYYQPVPMAYPQGYCNPAAYGGYYSTPANPVYGSAPMYFPPYQPQPYPVPYQYAAPQQRETAGHDPQQPAGEYQS